MSLKEPFYDGCLTFKKHLGPDPKILKIPNSTDYPLSVNANPPFTSHFSRRPSMEPYYRTNSCSSQLGSSSQSSYAKLSDIFDYHYYSLLRSDEIEEALVFDSESDCNDYDNDYDDDCCNNALNLKRDGSVQPLANSYMMESEDESELEDYKVHLLTFKFNSRAQFTCPPKMSHTMASDNFEEQWPRNWSEIIQTTHHPSPKASHNGIHGHSVLFPSPHIELTQYLERCNTVLVDKNPKVTAKTPEYRNPQCNDSFEFNSKELSIRDDFEIPSASFFI